MKFLIPEVSSEMIEIDVPQHLQQDIYDIFEESAKIFYWGMEGWNCIWPLYFEMYSDNEVLAFKADIYILSNEQNLIFDVIIKEGIKK